MPRGITIKVINQPTQEVYYHVLSMSGVFPSVQLLLFHPKVDYGETVQLDLDPSYLIENGSPITDENECEHQQVHGEILYVLPAQDSSASNPIKPHPSYGHGWMTPYMFQGGSVLINGGIYSSDEPDENLPQSYPSGKNGSVTVDVTMHATHAIINIAGRGKAAYYGDPVFNWECNGTFRYDFPAIPSERGMLTTLEKEGSISVSRRKPVKSSGCGSSATITESELYSYFDPLGLRYRALIHELFDFKGSRDKSGACRSALKSLDSEYLDMNNFENFKSWAEYRKGVVNPSTQRALRRAVNSSNKLLGMSTATANLWLQNHYGWAMDIEDLTKIFNALPIVASNCRKWPKRRVHGTSTIGDWTTRCTVQCAPYESTLLRLQAHGLRPTLANAWDLLPMSFIVDWFIPTGETLEEMQFADDWGHNRWSVHFLVYSAKAEKNLDKLPESLQLHGVRPQVRLTSKRYYRWVEERLPEYKFSIGDADPSSHCWEAGALVLANVT